MTQSGEDLFTFTGMSILLVPGDTCMHQRAAGHANVCSSHSRPTPEAVTSKPGRRSQAPSTFHRPYASQRIVVSENSSLTSGRRTTMPLDAPSSLPVPPVASILRLENDPELFSFGS